MVKQALSVSFSSPPCLLRVAHLAFSPSHSLPELESMVRCMSLCDPSSALSLSLLRYLLLDSICCCRSTGKASISILGFHFSSFLEFGFLFQ
ncbi:hypothetical protein ACFX19_028727 [Malus domestica]